LTANAITSAGHANGVNPPRVAGICLAEFADELSGMGWDLETLSDVDLGLLQMVYGPDSQFEREPRIGKVSQIGTVRLEFSLN
jgi:hypothetical protein